MGEIIGDEYGLFYVCCVPREEEGLEVDFGTGRGSTSNLIIIIDERGHGVDSRLMM